MEIELQKIELPKCGKFVKHEFYTYDPENDFTEEKNLFYLKEDLLQIEFEKLNLIIDLGWYGEISKNNGNFKIFVVENQDWENPRKVEVSSSQKKIFEKLSAIIEEINKAYT
jgi:hypothetical protein